MSQRRVDIDKLAARIAEDETRAKGMEPGDNRRALAAECDIKRRIIRICQEQPPKNAARAEAALQALALQSHKESA